MTHQSFSITCLAMIGLIWTLIERILFHFSTNSQGFFSLFSQSARFITRLLKKHFLFISMSAFATKQSDNLMKSLKAGLLRLARNDRSVGFPANFYYWNFPPLWLRPKILGSHAKEYWMASKVAHNNYFFRKSRPTRIRSVFVRSPMNLRRGGGSFLMRVGVAIICSPFASTGCL